jgi:hypothetical protein
MDAVVKFFRTPGGHYLYDRNRNAVLSVTPEQYTILSDDIHPLHKEMESEFQEKGYCKCAETCKTTGCYACSSASSFVAVGDIRFLYDGVGSHEHLKLNVPYT